jgi:hypothetical protein
MLGVLEPALREWLQSRGLDMMQMEPSEDEAEAGTTPYVVIIPPGSRLARLL